MPILLKTWSLLHSPHVRHLCIKSQVWFPFFSSDETAVALIAYQSLGKYLNGSFFNKEGIQEVKLNSLIVSGAIHSEVKPVLSEPVLLTLQNTQVSLPSKWSLKTILKFRFIACTWVFCLHGHLCTRANSAHRRQKEYQISYI